MLQCDNFRLYIATLANIAANIVAKTNYVYSLNDIKRIVHPIFVFCSLDLPCPYQCRW